MYKKPKCCKLNKISRKSLREFIVKTMKDSFKIAWKKIASFANKQKKKKETAVNHKVTKGFYLLKQLLRYKLFS